MFIIWGENTFSKRNIRKVHGECERCHRVGPLSHYDGTRFFTLYWLPVIPMGSKHVFDECPSCKAGRAMPLKDWRRLVDDELLPAIDRYVAAPTNREAAEAALRATVVLADADRFTEVALAVEEHFGADAEMLQRLGGHYAYFFMNDEAEGAFRGALATDDTADTRQALAVFLMDNHRPAEAEEHVHAVLASGDARRAALGLVLAESYLHADDTESAQRAIDAAVACHPGIADDPDHDRLVHAIATPRARQKMQKQAAKQATPAPAATATTGGPPPAREPSVLVRALPFLVPALLAAVAIGVAIALLRPSAPAIYAINGTDAPYTVLVNGEAITLQPRRPEQLDIDGETIRLEPTGDAARYPAIETGVMQGGDSVMILNPDRLAVIWWQHAEYVDLSHNADPMYHEKLHWGESVYRFKDIDHVMEGLPDEVSLSSSTSRTYRKSVMYLDQWDPVTTVKWLLDEDDGERAAKVFCTRALEFNPDLTELAGYAAFLMDYDEFMAIAKPHLDDRPVRVEWHRTRQNAFEMRDPSRSLAEEYLAIWQAEPAARSSDLAYLIARVIDDPAESKKWIDRACDDAHPSPRALYGRAYAMFGRGEFDAALVQLDRAIAMAPSLAQADDIRNDLLMALGRHDELIRIFRSRAGADPGDSHAAETLATLYELTGQPDKAEAEANRSVEFYHSQGDIDDEALRNWVAHLGATRAAARGDRAAIIRAARSNTSAAWNYTADLLEGKLAEAAAALDDLPGMDAANERMLIAALAYKAGQPDLANRSLDRAIEALRHQNHDSYRLADALAADAPPTVAEAVHWAGQPDRIRVVMALLAAKYPDGAGPYRALGRTMNFDPRHPRLLVADIVGE